MCYKQIRKKKKEIFFLDLLQRIRYKLTMAVYKCLHGGGADILGGRLSGNLCHCWQATPAVRWHRDTVSTKDKDHAGDEEFRSRRSSHLEQYSDQQLYVPSLSLDIWRPTCSADQQRVWGPIMMRFTNLLIITMIIIILSEPQSLKALSVLCACYY